MIILVILSFWLSVLAGLFWVIATQECQTGEKEDYHPSVAKIIYTKYSNKACKYDQHFRANIAPITSIMGKLKEDEYE